MVKLLTPSSIAAPASRYSHGAEAGPNARWLHVSGQVGTNADGSIAEGLEAQLHRVWANTLAVLEEAGMGVKDIVKVNTLLTDGSSRSVSDTIDLSIWRALGTVDGEELLGDF